MRQHFAIFAAALWWGSLTMLGFVVVPMLFANLGAPAVAGAMAAKLFTAQTWVSIGCCMLFLLISNKREAVAPSRSMKFAIKFVVAGLLLAVLVEFGVSPRIISARAEGGDLKLWHAMGSSMYLLQWLCAGATLWMLSRQAAHLKDALQPPAY